MPQEESQAAPPALPEITGTPGTSCPALDASAIAAAATAGESIDAATGEPAPPEDAPTVDAITAELPNTPITRRNLQAVIIPAPKGNTLTRYITADGERYAHYEDLTQEEKNIVLEFLLRYAAPLIARKPKRRTSPEDATPPELPELPELDAEPLERMLEEIEKGEKGLENHGKA